MLGDLKRNIYKYLLNRGLLRTKIVVLMDGAILVVAATDGPTEESTFTDDTICTIAIADAINNGEIYIVKEVFQCVMI